MSEAHAESAIRAALQCEPPRLPVGYLYDDEGARLYARIIEQPEYALFRADRRLVEHAAEAIVQRARPRELFELGAGPGRKIRALLDAGRGRGLARCVQFDIHRDFVDASVARLTASYPEVDFQGRVGDFLVDLDDEPSAAGRLVVCFGGTLGNLERRDALRLLERARALLTGDGHLVASLALRTTPDAMLRTYRDAAGLNDAFGLNTLKVVNHRWGGDFDVDVFAHVPVWVPERSLIEMRLVAQPRDPGPGRAAGHRARLRARGLDRQRHQRPLHAGRLRRAVERGGLRAGDLLHRADRVYGPRARRAGMTGCRDGGRGCGRSILGRPRNGLRSAPVHGYALRGSTVRGALGFGF